MLHTTAPLLEMLTLPDATLGSTLTRNVVLFPAGTADGEAVRVVADDAGVIVYEELVVLDERVPDPEKDALIS
jgi:hypothetical protein